MLNGTLGRPDGSAPFWPGLIDLVTSALMVFLLLSFVQTAFDVDEVEALLAREQQARFVERFRHELGDELAAGDLAVERHLGFLQITFSDRVLFDSGEHRLKPAGRRILERCAAVFHQAADTGYRQVQVEGHTDSLPVRQGSYPADNWELATARAISVVQFLVAEGGMEPGVFSANGYADQRPVADNATAEGRRRNRRIELRVFFAPRRPGPAGRE